MSDSISNSSNNIFSIDKNTILFKINNNKNSLNLSSSLLSHNKSISECIIKITNLTSNYLAMRIRTTKKEFYTVTPSYSIIEPNSDIKVNFQLYIKDNSLFLVNNSEHKFKFECVVLDKYNNEEPKKIFEGVEKNNLKYKIESIKKIAEFIDTSNDNNIINPNTLITSSKNSFIDKNSNSNLNSSNINNNTITQKNIDNEQEKNELERLKVEYYKLKNELSNLSQNYINLKNSVDMEKNGEILNNFNKKLTYYLPEKREMKISTKLALIFCLTAIILGYYITD